MIFDTHAHYDDEIFNEDRDELLWKMKEQGVDFIVNVGSSIASTEKTLELVERYPFLYGSVGVHPSETGELTENRLLWLEEVCSKEKIVAVGEIGLDYHWPEPEREIQKKWFRRQLVLASKVELPVIIHSRDAAEDTLRILKEWDKDKTGGVIHCFSYTKEIAREYLSMGYYFGIGGVLTFKNARKLAEAVEIIPMDKILLETDCPYLAPEPYRGKRNQSVYIDLVAEKLAELKGIDKKEVLRITSENAKAFYHLK